jgi:hypothetical protein
MEREEGTDQMWALGAVVERGDERGLGVGSLGRPRPYPSS